MKSSRLDDRRRSNENELLRSSGSVLHLLGNKARWDKRCSAHLCSVCVLVWLQVCGLCAWQIERCVVQGTRPCVTKWGSSSYDKA